MPEYELNLRDYWIVIQKRRLVLGVIFFAVLIITGVYTQTQKPMYRAVSSVQWLERRSLGGLLTELVMVRTGDPLASQARIITSLPVLEEVAMELGLVSRLASAEEIIQKAASLQRKVSTDVITGTNIIRIIVHDSDPQMAASIANKVAEVYVIENQKEKSKESRSVREFIEKQLAELTVKLKTSEETLADFKEKEAPSGIALILQDRLADLEAKQRDLLQLFTERHPEVEDLQAEIDLVREQFKTLPQRELEFSRLAREVDINTKLYRELKDKLEGARISEAEKVEDVSIVDRAVPPTSPITPNKPLNYSLGVLLGLMLGLSGAFLVEQTDTSIGTIEDVESYIKLPVLGIIPYLKTKEEKRRVYIPRLWPKELKKEERLLRLKNQLLIHYSSSSPIFEAYRMLRTNIQTEVFKEKLQGKLLVFSSSAPAEGKSITVANLAIAMAQGNIRTLLIDADMRRSAIHHIFGIKNKPGLSDVLRGTITVENAIKTLTDLLMGELGPDEALKIPYLDKLSILVSGTLPMMPAELLAGSEMASLLEKLRNTYDIILIDSPPVLTVADAIILSPKSDGVVLVHRVGQTSRSILMRAKNQLTECGAQLKGIVLNNISPQVEMRYGYYYYYKYYDKYYGEKETKT